MPNFYIERTGKKKSKLKLLFIYLIFILFIINLLGLATGNYFYRIAISKNKSPEYLSNYFNKEVEAGSFNVDRFKNLKENKITIASRYGYKLDGIYINNPRATDNTVIAVHGIGQDKWTMMKYADIYIDEGYNVFIYDSRNHGSSGGTNQSYGYYEKDDLEEVVKYIKKQNPKGIIGVQGESMGSATALLHAETYNKNGAVAFYIADCSYSDLYKLFSLRLNKDFHIPNLLIVDYASLVCRIRSGFSFKDISPLKNIDKINVPVMFVHGEKDNFVPKEMSIEMYNKKIGIKKLYIAKDASHGEAIKADKYKYKQEVKDFLNLFIKK